MKETILKESPLAGKWRSRVVAGSQGEGMQTKGPNPPFYPDEPGWTTMINNNGTGTVDYRNWKLTGTFCSGGNVLSGTWTIDETPSGTGQFCLIYVTGQQREPMFIGVSINSAGVWQAWYGRR